MVVSGIFCPRGISSTIKYSVTQNRNTRLYVGLCECGILGSFVMSFFSWADHLSKGGA
jgi:hypothetical protein